MKVTAVPFTHFARATLGVKLNPAQTAWSKVAFDRIEPAKLKGAERDLGLQMFGGVERIPASAFRLVLNLKGARVGGSYLGALRGLHLAMTADLSQLVPGQTATVAICATKLQVAKEVFSFYQGGAQHSPHIAPHVTNSTAESFTITRPTDGRSVVFKILPLAVGGADLRGQWFEWVHFSELSIAGDESAAASAHDNVNQAMSRLLPGAGAYIETTPWAESGLVYDLFKECFGKPGRALVSRCPTMLMRGDDPTIAALVDAERQRDPENARREFDAEFASSVAALLTSADIDRCVVPRAGYWKPVPGVEYAIGLDIGLRRDSTAIVVAHRELTWRDNAPPLDEVVVDYALELKPSKSTVFSQTVGNAVRTALGQRSAPTGLDMDDVERAVVSVLEQYPGTVHADKHYFDAIAPRLRARGYTVEEAPVGPSAQEKRANVLLSKIGPPPTLRLIDHAELIAQLKQLQIRRLPSGIVQIAAPNQRSKHDDLADALLIAVEAATALPAGGDVVMDVKITRIDSHVEVEPIYYRIIRDPKTGAVKKVPCAPPPGTVAADQATIQRRALGIFLPEELNPDGTPKPLPERLLNIPVRHW